MQYLVVVVFSRYNAPYHWRSQDFQQGGQREGAKRGSEATDRGCERGVSPPITVGRLLENSGMKTTLSCTLLGSRLL